MTAQTPGRTLPPLLEKKKAGPVLENPQTSRSVPTLPFTWLLGCSLVFPCQGLQEHHRSLWHPGGAVCFPGSLVRVSPPSDRAVGLRLGPRDRVIVFSIRQGSKGLRICIPPGPRARTTPPFRPQDADVSILRPQGGTTGPSETGPQPHQSPPKGSPSILEAGQASLPS